MSITDTLAKVLKAEVGYHEGRSNGHWNNHEKYADLVPGLEWVDNAEGAWCAVFAAWAYQTAGLPKGSYPVTASCATGVSWFKARKRFSAYPAIGAQVFFGPGGGTHTGVVVAYDATYVYTVEGNTNTNGSPEGDGVYAKTHRRTDSYVYGYGYPQFAEGIKSADPSWSDKAAALGVKGIDVSSHQAEDYDLTGVDFVAVKATEGTTYENPKRAAQVKRARDKGRVVGHYHFVRPGDMKAQADRFLKVAAPKPGEFLALDWEDPNVSCADKDAFLKYLKSKAGGRKVLLYCNSSYWLNRDTTSYAADGLWIAQYSVKAGQPGIESAWLIHQYTDSPVDTNVTHWASRAEMQKWAGAVPTAPKPTPKPSAKPVVDLSNVVAARKKDLPAATGHTTHKADVVAVEHALSALGHLDARWVDGSWGSKTDDAYNAYRRKKGYKGSDATGAPGLESLTRLAKDSGLFTVKA
jgi:GH25 family lysozyme M1 (1,4-beta-N-acetylmuramidase)